jgi:hypothetical protein
MSRGFFPADDHSRRPTEPVIASSQKRMITSVALIGTIGWTLGLFLLLDQGTPEPELCRILGDEVDQAAW